MSTVSASTGVARPTLGLSARSKPRRITRAIHSRRALFASATSSSVSIVEDRARATITYCFGEETRTTAAEIVFSVDGFDVYGPALAEPEAPADLAPEPVDPTLGVVDDSGAVTYSFDDGDDVDPEIRPAGDVDNDPTEATRDLSADDASTPVDDAPVPDARADAMDAPSEPWVPFTHSGDVCFEVVLDISDGLASAGVTFARGPDGRPVVAEVDPAGSAAGEVKVGDVLLETSAVTMRADPEGVLKFGVPTQTWRDTKDWSFEDCATEMRTNVGEWGMRLCRDYEPRGAIPMRGVEPRASTDEEEWNEEAISCGKEWAERNAAGGF